MFRTGDSVSLQVTVCHVKHRVTYFTVNKMTLKAQLSSITASFKVQQKSDAPETVRQEL